MPRPSTTLATDLCHIARHHVGIGMPRPSTALATPRSAVSYGLGAPVPLLRWILECRGSPRLCHGLGDTGPATLVDPGIPRRHRSRYLGGS